MEVITSYGFDVASVSIMFTACFVKYVTSKDTHIHTHTHRYNPIISTLFLLRKESKLKLIEKHNDVFV